MERGGGCVGCYMLLEEYGEVWVVKLLGLMVSSLIKAPGCLVDFYVVKTFLLLSHLDNWITQMWWGIRWHVWRFQRNGPSCLVNDFYSQRHSYIESTAWFTWFEWKTFNVWLGVYSHYGFEAKPSILVEAPYVCGVLCITRLLERTRRKRGKNESVSWEEGMTVWVEIVNPIWIYLCGQTSCWLSSKRREAGNGQEQSGPRPNLRPSPQAATKTTRDTQYVVKTVNDGALFIDRFGLPLCRRSTRSFTCLSQLNRQARPMYLERNWSPQGNPRRSLCHYWNSKEIEFS